MSKNEIKETAQRLKLNIDSAAIRVDYESFLAVCKRDIKKLLKLISISDRAKK